MNSVYKFHSNEKFDFPAWSQAKAAECVEASAKELNRRGLNITETEKKSLAFNLLTKKGMTFHFYYSGGCTEKDVKALRPKVEKKEEKN